jgi:hypothetical protein
MNETSVELEIYSPRWGHEDTYTIHLTRDVMTITMQVRVAKCTWRENVNPEWSGKTLEGILNNDMIYPPSILQDLIERAWKAWRDGEIDSVQVDTELQELGAWLNTVTKSKPRTDFWKRYF